MVLPKDYTTQENIIAECLSELGFRYDEQHAFWPYTVDFYIPELNLIIEADGKYGHLRKRDIKRDIFLSGQEEVENILHVRETTKALIKDNLLASLEELN